MDGCVIVTAALLLASVAAAATPTTSTTSTSTTTTTTTRPGSNDPCEHHTCPAGEECVSHEVVCSKPPCSTPQTKIGECRAVNCTLPCLEGYECARRERPCSRPPCPIREECVAMTNACQGRCRPDQLCLTSVKVKPCELPPCAESVCVARGTSLSARHQPPPPSFCDNCPAPAVCVPTQVCRQFNECLFLPVCLTNCTAMWCGDGHECRMQRHPQCDGDDCPLEPTCVPDGSLRPPADTNQPGGVLVNRFSSEPREPQCVVKCTPDEECRFMPTRCVRPPCATVARCVPRSPPRPAAAAAAAAVDSGGGGGAAAAAAAGPPLGGECPLDDLRVLASKAFCATASLHQCSSDGECETHRRCCDRGCGRSCLPTCRAGCGPGTECRLVAVKCFGSPCPKVAQCIPSEDELLSALAPSAAESQSESASRPVSSPAASASASASASSAASAGFGSSSDSVQSSVSGGSAKSKSVSRADRPPQQSRPGLCPVNNPQEQARICFGETSKNLCDGDSACPKGQRCCLRNCQRLCRPICDSCAPGLQCRIRLGDSLPSCLRPLTNPRRINRRLPARPRP